MPSKKTMTIGGLLYVLLFAGSAETITDRDKDDRCKGTERWNVKVMADADAQKVNTHPKIATIEELTAIPTEETKVKENNRADFEMQEVTVQNVAISKVIKENDNDYHLVLEDGKGNHLIGEIPDPDCQVTGTSDWAENFSGARSVMKKHSHDYRHHLFTITGVLFKDRSHGQTGAAKNDLEIHPILKLQTQHKPR